ncbi:MAG: hypothetical protein LBV08_00735, partial [Clostridiales bacterium]|nr:hypothetical protein [Clostridiales bacterium]
MVFIKISKMPLSAIFPIYFVLSALIVLISEFISRQSIIEVYEWLGGNIVLFFTAMFLIFVLLLLLLALTNRLYAPFFVVQGIVFLLSCISYFKQSQRNEPLFMADITLSNSIIGVIGEGNVWLTKPIISSFIIFVLITLVLFLFQRGFYPPDLNQRVFNLVFALMVSNYLLFTSFFNSNLWDDISYSSKGFVLGFLSHALYDPQTE